MARVVVRRTRVLYLLIIHNCKFVILLANKIKVLYIT